MTETQRGARPRKLKTDQAGLELVQMLSSVDDKAYLDLQTANVEYWKEFGNTIDRSLHEVAERRLRNGNARYGIWLMGKLIGIVEYSTQFHENEAEIGVLMDKRASGYGYAKSAVVALVEFAKPHFNRVYAEVAPDNTRSINLLTRAGFQSGGDVVERTWGRARVFEAPK